MNAPNEKGETSAMIVNSAQRQSLMTQSFGPRCIERTY